MNSIRNLEHQTNNAIKISSPSNCNCLKSVIVDPTSYAFNHSKISPRCPKIKHRFGRPLSIRGTLVYITILA